MLTKDKLNCAISLYETHMYTLAAEYPNETALKAVTSIVSDLREQLSAI